AAHSRLQEIRTWGLSLASARRALRVDSHSSSRYTAALSARVSVLDGATPTTRVASGSSEKGLLRAMFSARSTAGCWEAAGLTTINIFSCVATAIFLVPSEFL